jgi:predicted Zn-dependent protease
MKASLEPPDSLHLEAAEGWIGFGDYRSAAEELDRITAANRTHPSVLQLRWRISAEAHDWQSCLDIATPMTATNPKGLFGWIHRAKSLHQLGRTQEAKDLLVSVVDNFPSNSTIPFHLARYCCGLGQNEEALRWLAKAVAAADGPEELFVLRRRLVEDPVLEPLRRKT